jgi:hypothetical protein
MLTKVQKRAVDRVTSKKADTDPAYAKKNKETADRAWDRMTDKDVAEARANTKAVRTGLSKREKRADPTMDAKKKSEQDAAWERLQAHMNKPENMDVLKRLATKEEQNVPEGWSQKYKNSINCSNPKGFSQKAHCAGKKKQNESVLKDKEDLQAKRKALQDIQTDPHTHKDPELKAELAWRKAQLEKEAKAKGLSESKTQKQEAPKPRNFVAKNAINTGAGAHKDKKKAAKQGDVKHKGKAMDLAEMEASIEEAKASLKLCKSSKPDDELGASQLASCKSQGLRSRDGNKSHKLGKSAKSRVKVGGHKIKGQKYGGPLPDWS